ncbi:hypothetical protein QZH41_013405 [Actinostola sp. cb2023]|nr:hypothetical protein QZH41_013405 [Actinostola sp. cb2023]
MASGRSRKSSKRSVSSSPSASSPFASKKRRPLTPLIADDIDSPSSSPASFTTTTSDFNTANTAIVFKDPNFEMEVLMPLQLSHRPKNILIYQDFL